MVYPIACSYLRHVFTPRVVVFMHFHKMSKSPTELAGRISLIYSPVSLGIFNAENLQ